MASTTLNGAVPAGDFSPPLADQFATPCNRMAVWQCLSTVIPIAGIWFAIATIDLDSLRNVLIAVGLAGLLTLFLLRVFVLMHDCGHNSLFRSRLGNRAMGFVFGVLAGMPQMVWARHHQYHHQTNGNWARYRGPLNIATVEQYRAMSPAAQRRYRMSRSIWLAPLAGFFYLILSPRITWLRATAALARCSVSRSDEGELSIAQLSSFGTPYCRSICDYRHMLWNNLALLSAAAGLALCMGLARFVPFYLLPLSLAGGGAIVLFSIQHNFDGSYASGDEGWDRQRAALDGTSLLVLPRWLNWFTADIAYHHVHHLCARVPNYRLASCHDQHAAHFRQVRRISLAQVPRHARCILWDRESRSIVSPQGIGATPTAPAADTRHD